MLIELRLGDCMDILPTMADNSAAAVITDPHYGDGIEDCYLKMPPQAFLDQCLRIATGPVVWFCPAAKILELADYNPNPDRILIWAPKNALPVMSKDGFGFMYYPIAIWRPVKQAVMPWDVLEDAMEMNTWWHHPGTKPVSLMRKLVRACGKNILDPYMGSGSTGVACAQFGFDFTGIEIDESYLRVAEERIKNAHLSLSVFLT